MKLWEKLLFRVISFYMASIVDKNILDVVQLSPQELDQIQRKFDTITLRALIDLEEDHNNNILL